MSSMLITSEDVERILDLDIIRLVFHAYGGFGVKGIKHEVDRNDLISAETLLVLKAFFIPSTAIPNRPDTKSALQTLQAAMMNTSFEPDLEKIALEAKYLAAGFGQYVDPTIPPEKRPLMSLSGLGRKFDILTKHFGIDVGLVEKALYQISLANRQHFLVTHAETKAESGGDTRVQNKEQDQ